VSLIVEKGVLTAPGGTGVQTYTLGAAFSGVTPKAVILWTTGQTAAGAANKHGEMYFGCATFDGAAVQQWYLAFTDEDAVGTSNTSRGSDTTACLTTLVAGATTVDSIATLDSFNSGNFKLNWTDAPASAILVHYIVIGGDDLSAARAGSYAMSTAVATQDVTVASGWGQPALILSGTISSSVTGQNGGSARIHLGFAKSATARGAGGFWSNDGAVNMTNSMVQKQAAVVAHSSVSTVDAEADLSAKASWPADGFQISYSNQAATAFLIFYLALKGTFQSAVGANSAPTSGSPPVVQNNDAGFPPVGGLFFGWANAASSSVDANGADVFGWFFGGTDGTNEGLSAITQDDGNTTSFAGNVHSETKSVANYIAGTGGTDPPSLQSEADGSFSGNNVSLSWDDIDSVAREYIWVALGDAPVIFVPRIMAYVS